MNKKKTQTEVSPEVAEKEAAAEETAEESSSDSEMGGQSDVDNFNSTQKIIKRYDYRYETEKFDDAYAYLKNLIDKDNQYVPVRLGSANKNAKALFQETLGIGNLWLNPYKQAATAAFYRDVCSMAYPTQAIPCEEPFE